jgi:hypothetical protein
MTEYLDGLHGVLHRQAEARTQAREFKVTPSAIGFCRNKLALDVRGISRSDIRASLSAEWGTAIHEHIASARRDYGDSRIIVSPKVLTTIPVRDYGNAEINGTADECDPAENSVTDFKTTDTVARYRSAGPTQAHRWQNHIYALGLIQSGTLREEGLISRHVYIDRDGSPDFYVHEEPFDPTLTDEISAWLSDVFYAVHNTEDAPQDVAAPVCEAICEHFTNCRGSLPMEDGGIITDSEQLLAVDLYNQGKDLEKEGKALKDSAKIMLDGVNGSTGKYMVRWVQVNPGRVEAFERQAYARMDVRKVKGA